MNATAAVRGLFRTPRAGPIFRRIEVAEDDPALSGWQARTDNIRNILGQCGHTVAGLSALTRDRFGMSSPYFIPPTFLYKLRNGITPHVCQIAALSESTGYRFVDWLQLFGFDLHQIPRLQMRLHTERTVLFTPIDGREFFLPGTCSGYENFTRSYPFSRIAMRECSASSRYLFAKIGARDADVSPKLLPGGIVRVDRCFGESCFGEHGFNEHDYAQWIRNGDQASTDGRLWLVELPGGLTCCRLRWIDHQQIVLLPTRSPWGCWPLRLPTEARVLGLVDSDHQAQHSSSEWVEDKKEEKKKTLSDLLRISRGRTGLTFRSAHGLTCTIAQAMGNRDYAISLGMLSDYEVMGKLPRHTAKILSLCIVYCMDVWELMKAAGVYIDDSAKLPLPAPYCLQLPSQYFNPVRHSQAVS